MVGFAVGFEVGFEVGLVEGLVEGFGEGSALGVELGDGSALGEASTLGEGSALRVGLGDGSALGEASTLGEGSALGVGLGDGSALGEASTLGEGSALGDALALGSASAGAVGLAVGKGVPAGGSSGWERGAEALFGSFGAPPSPRSADRDRHPCDPLRLAVPGWARGLAFPESTVVASRELGPSSLEVESPGADGESEAADWSPSASVVFSASSEDVGWSPDDGPSEVPESPADMVSLAVSVSSTDTRSAVDTRSLMETGAWDIGSCGGTTPGVVGTEDCEVPRAAALHGWATIAPAVAETAARSRPETMVVRLLGDIRGVMSSSSQFR
ncbi:hypothetical protein ACFHYQ_05815 [Sphaerimonospora cavernae]|uniref:Uncharacterized protein n=1 Tax=Sphaerimonospora cavernae TaxID=1740611 RepID=A0ABV6U050_9ACTN